MNPVDPHEKDVVSTDTPGQNKGEGQPQQAETEPTPPAVTVEPEAPSTPEPAQPSATTPEQTAPAEPASPPEPAAEAQETEPVPSPATEPIQPEPAEAKADSDSPASTPVNDAAAEPPAEVAEAEAAAQPQSETPTATAADPTASGETSEGAKAEAKPAPPKPSRPAQPVPQVPAAPQSQELSRIAQDLQIRKPQVEAVVQLLDDDNTVPFITRYRKERTGGLDEVQIRRIQERVTALRELANRKQTILRTIANRGLLTDELTEAILNAEHPKRLEDLYLPYKPKKKTLATEAKEKGLEPLADAIWNRDPVATDLNEILAARIDEWKQLHTADDVAAGVRHIIAEWIADRADVRGPLRAFLWDTAALTSVKIETVPDGKGKEYKDYFQFKEEVRLIPPHRILAVNRGERENILRIRLEFDTNIARNLLLEALPLADHPHKEFLYPAAEDALLRLVLPSLEREIRRDLTDRAQTHAIEIFARNLRSLLLRPPLVGKRVLAIDPGVRTGCKVAVVDETGKLLEHTVVYPHQPQRRVKESKRKLEQLIRKYQTPIVAIGNGTACRETEQLISDLIGEFEHRRLNPHLANEAAEAESSAASTPAASASEPPPQGSDNSTTTSPIDGSAGQTIESVSTEVGPSFLESSEMMIVSGPVLPDSAPELAHSPAMIDSPGEPEVVQSPAVLTEKEAEKEPEPESPPIDLQGLPEPPAELAYIIVIESGASDYSASPIAKEEFPDLDASARGTLSIGRRLQDPLAELVKIDPQHIGVGLYQHDVKAKQLKFSLEAVVESCVNLVGVDVNTASVPLLRYVSGLNQLVARELVEYRNKNGPFTTRETLQSVPQLGDTRFIQAAGFLKIRDGNNPLDTTWVHPESYALAEKILAEVEFQPADLRDRAKLEELRNKLAGLNVEELAAKLETGPMTVADIIEALGRPDRDPREDRPKPIFRRGVLKIEDLSQGMELQGEVLNVVDFGAFVDIGLKESGLVHISQMANRYIRSPYEVVAVGDVVPVWVLNVDTNMNRVSLSMIPPWVERKPQNRPPRGERGERPPQPPRERGERGPRPPRGERPPRPAQGQPQPAGAPHGQPAQAPQARAERPPQGSGPGGPGRGGPRGGGGPKPGGFRPRGPGAPGWRSSPSQQGGKPTEAAKPAGDSPPPTPRKPQKPKVTPKLNDNQKVGKEPLNSFAQLAALFQSKTEPEQKPGDQPKPAQDDTGSKPQE